MAERKTSAVNDFAAIAARMREMKGEPALQTEAGPNPGGCLCCLGRGWFLSLLGGRPIECAMCGNPEGLPKP